MFKFVSTKNINELFQRAILHNDIQRTKLILEEAMKDPRFNIDQINEEGLTALQYSCFAGNVEIVKILTAYGANWRIRDRDGYTLMHASAMAGNGAVMRFLLQLGLKPTLKTDDGMLPIDVTDEISIIVILLRAMLDQGFLQEMQDYMMDHPKLKRNIFKELEKVKCREKEKVEILNEMPYTSRTALRQKTQDKGKKSKTREAHRRSTSTFSELSDSIQQLDKLETSGLTDLNNNECDASDTYVCPRSDVYHRASEPDTDTLKRENSFSSSSSHSSHRSGSGTGGILRHGNRQEHNDVDNAYRNTQQYLESRFPAASSRPKSVTFEFDTDLLNNNRKYSDCHPTNNYGENSVMSLQPPRSSQNNVIDLKPVAAFDEPLYENAASARMRAKLSNTGNPSNKIYFQTSQKQIPPPLPPRAPTTQLSDGLRLNHVSYNNNRTYEDNNYISDRQLGSETDSGIDVNETAGRVFALSVNDRRDEDSYNRTVSYQGENYSKPNGLYYSEQLKGSLARQHPQDDQEPPCSFAVRKNYDNPKYRSWNGRSFHEAELTPYNSHCRNTNTNDNFYDTRYSHNTNESAHVTGSVPNISEANYQGVSVHKNIEPIDFSRYDFDNQPEIML